MTAAGGAGADMLEAVRILLRDTLQVGSRADGFSESTPLLGAMPEFDSMAVVTLIGAMEDQYGIDVEDDEITAELFATVGSLSRFLQAKLGS